VLKVTILAIGKDKDRWVTDGAAHYEKLLGRWCRLEWDVVPSPRDSAGKSPDEIKKDEAQRLLARVGDGFVVALADCGRSTDSRQFARLIEQWQISSVGRVTFVIGGPYGLDESVLRRAGVVLSLSPLTFSHQLVRLVLLEQLYRGFSILHGTDYHK
jgi:23S rRNA (pseudouridine1915-N3)-methyltransferase